MRNYVMMDTKSQKVWNISRFFERSQAVSSYFSTLTTSPAHRRVSEILSNNARQLVVSRHTPENGFP
jgi:hypothetical protein